MRRRLLIATVLVLLAACGGDDGDETTEAADTDSTETTGTTADDTTTTADDADGDGATVELATSDLGEILVDAEGRTLYLFTRDTGPESTCEGDCASTWPPLTTDGEPTAGDGIDAELGTTTRPDGTEQVTIAGHPLYFFANDEAAGDTNGQGIGGVWYVVGPDGEAITGAADSAGEEGAAPATGGSGDSYSAAAPPATSPPTTARAAAPPSTRATAPPTTARPAPAPTPAAPTTAPPPTTAAPTTTAPRPQAARITIANFAFSPPATRVAPGAQVTATNNDAAAHTWTASDGSWDSGSLAQGATFSHTFTRPGTFAYFCAIHPSMRGTVTVS